MHKLAKRNFALFIFALFALLRLESNSFAKPAYLQGIYDRALYERAIEAEKSSSVPITGVSGITVPHHLVAADLISRGFYAASGRRYKRVVVISPDHFRLHETGAVLFDDPINTVFGTLRPDLRAIKHIRNKADPVLELQVRSTPEGEHGLQAIMPFVKHFFPDTQIVPVLMGISTKPEQWAAMADILEQLINQDTLIVQSTDFSHYLTHGEAVLNDQQTINAISTGDPLVVLQLDQPGHLDSRAAMAIQLDLQLERLGQSATVIANRNLADYHSGSTKSTTSYLTIIYSDEAADTAQLRYDDQSLFYIGGDVYLGRDMTPLLTNEPALEVLSDSIFNITRGAPLVVNLEGTLLPNSVPGVPPNLHSMQTNLAARALKAMGVSVASLANNHSYDLGEVGFQTTRDELRHLGIASIEHGQFFDLGNARLLAMNHVKGRGNDTGGVLNGDLPNELCFADVEPPVVVFTHWGVEYLRSFDMQTRALARNYVRCGFAVVVGGHSHLAAIGTNSFNDNRGLGVFSLGNLAFDQTGDKGSGALLEIRIFGAGTLAARLIPLPNLFDQMQNAAGHRLKPVR